MCLGSILLFTLLLCLTIVKYLFIPYPYSSSPYNALATSHCHAAALSTTLKSLSQSKYSPTVSPESISNLSPQSVLRIRLSIGTDVLSRSTTSMPNRFWVKKNTHGTSRLCTHVGDMATGHFRQALRHSAAPTASSWVMASGKCRAL